jgi:hypothetical protein
MTYGGKQDGSATLTLSKDEKARLEAGEKITKVTSCRTGIKSLTVQIVTECPSETTRKFLLERLGFGVVDPAEDVAKALDLIRQVGADGGWVYVEAVNDLTRLVNHGFGDVSIKQLLGLEKAPSARIPCDHCGGEG